MKFSRYLTLIVCLMCPCFVFAQSTTAAILGAVEDQTKNLITGAQVTAINTQTGATTSTLTNESGMYILPALPPGTYRIEVDKEGFQGIIQAGIVLHVQDALQVNFHMSVGSTSETVTVSSEGELLNTTSSAIGMTVNENEVAQLPLNGRDPQSLVFLAPGVTNGTAYGVIPNQASFAFSEETGPSAGVGAGRAGGAYFLLDGASNLDDYLGLASPFPNADATQEFKVITNNFSAQYGFAPGAVVSIATKSGTNNWHGGAWNFLRNESLNASNWFSDKVDPLHRNQFGADIGGPILKNKLFFFANYQGTQQSTTSTAGVEYTYTSAMLNGDFSAVPVTLKAPFQTISGKSNQINPSLFDQTAVEVLKLIMPVSTSANAQLLYTTGKQITGQNEGTGRIDYTISPKQRIFARSYINYSLTTGSGVPGNISTYTPTNPGEDYNIAFGHIWLINQMLVNTLALANTQMDFKKSGQALMSNGQPFCWSKFINVDDPTGSCATQSLSLSGTDYSYKGPSVEPCQNNHGNDSLFDNLSAETGRHNLSFGINEVRRWMSGVCNFPSTPELAFGGQYTSYALADFLLGDVGTFTQGAGQSGVWGDWQLGMYAQDDFRYRPNLTFEVGVRWDPNFPIAVKNGRSATFVAGQQSTVYPNAPTGLVFPGDKGIGLGLMQTTYSYWEPRVGIAWQPHALPHTSLHAGFGIFTAPQVLADDYHVVTNSPFAPEFVLNGTAASPISLDNPWSGFAGTGGVSPFPPFATSNYRPASSVAFTSGLSIPDAIDPKSKLGMTQAWNLAVEEELGANTMVRVAYVGSESYHQQNTIDRNPGVYATGGTRSTYSAFGQILFNESAGTANYNGMQVTVERHLSHGLQFQSNWTWSKLIDLSSSSDLSLNAQSAYNPFNLRTSRGISLVNFPFIWVSNVIYTSPALSGRNQLMRQALGGWEVSGIITSQSGQPFTVYGGFGNNSSESLQDLDHANRVPGVALDVRQGSRSQWIKDYFNITAFTENPAGTFGNTGKDIMRGPPYNDADIGLDKNWRIVEKYTLQFRWEMFNAFNHPSFATPNATNALNSSNTSSGGIEGTITSIFGAPRVMQGALKFTF